MYCQNNRYFIFFGSYLRRLGNDSLYLYILAGFISNQISFFLFQYLADILIFVNNLDQFFGFFFLAYRKQIFWSFIRKNKQKNKGLYGNCDLCNTKGNIPIFFATIIFRYFVKNILEDVAKEDATTDQKLCVRS